MNNAPPRTAFNERRRSGTTHDTTPNAAKLPAGSEPGTCMPNPRNPGGSLEMGAVACRRCGLKQ